MRPMPPDDLPKNQDRVPLAAAGLTYLLGWVVLAWPWLSGRVTIPWDAKAQFLPQIQFLANSLARGESPAWNPFVFAGHPQLADPQSMIFSPPFLALAVLNGQPSAWAVDITVFVTIAIAGFALIAWFHDRGWHLAGAVIAALAFSFGAAMAWRIQHTGQVLSLAYLPITLFLLDRALIFGRSRFSAASYGASAGIVAGFLVLGRDQVALLSVYLLAAYVVWHIATAADRARTLSHAAGPLLAGGIAGLMVVTVPVIMTILIAGQSNRPEIDLAGAGRGSLHPVSILTLFAPDMFGSTGRAWDYWGAPSFAWHERWGDTGLNLAQNMGQLYLGAIPALLILIGLGSGVVLRRQIVFFTGALLVMTLYALGWYTPVFKLAHATLPGVDLYRRPADAVFLMGFIGAVLAGYMAHVVLSAKAHPARGSLAAGAFTAAVVTPAAFAAAVGLAVAMDHVDMATRPLLMAAMLFAVGGALISDAVWLNPIRPLLAIGLLIGFTVVDLGASNGPGGATGLPPASYDILDPASRDETIAILKRKTAESATATRRDRVELVGLGFASPNASITHRLENTLGYNPVRLGLYTSATGAEDSSGLPEQRKFTPLFPSYKSKLADLLGLRYIATTVPLAKLDPKANPADFPLVAKTFDTYVYENPRAMPRVMFAPRAAAADFASILATGVWPADDLTQTVLLDPANIVSSKDAATPSTGRVGISNYTNTTVDIEVESSAGGYVVLADVWHPWWTVTLDQVPTPLLRANVLFRAVRVPAGRHTVSFMFEPIRGAVADVVARRSKPN